MQSHPVPDRLQHRVRADDVGAQERFGIGQRIVDVSLRSEMYDGVRLGDERGHQPGVGDITLHQPDVVGDRGKGFAAACVGQRVEHRHRGPVLTHRTMHEVGADEPGSAGDQQPHGPTVAVGVRLSFSPSGPASSVSVGSSLSEPPST